MKFLITFIILGAFFIACNPKENDSIDTTQESNIPYLRKQGEALQLIVDNEPFIMIAGELHNSTASSVKYLETIWPKLVDMNLNTVLATVSWELFEPEEGVYDYSHIDALMNGARTNGLKLVVVWFGSWKNGESSYVPLWVKKDTKRFFRVKREEDRKSVV